MNIYKVKMFIKKSKIVQRILKHKASKGSKEKKIELKVSGLNVINSVEKALKNKGYLYFAACGTLLGIVREHGFIKGDIDVDYCIVISDDFDWNGFEVNLCEHGFKKIRQFKFRGAIKEQTYQIGKLTVDFFTLSLTDGEWCSYGFFRKDGYLYSSPYEFNVKKVVYVPVTQTMTVDFLGTSVTIPVNNEDVLACNYGESWRVPNPEWTMKSKEMKNVSMLDILGEGQFYC